MASGVVIRAWGVLLLGRFFTNDVRVQAGQTVVDSGP
jgi:protein-S-isoprenylcysteine O-methyltransferase Ste14